MQEVKDSWKWFFVFVHVKKHHCVSVVAFPPPGCISALLCSQTFDKFLLAGRFDYLTICAFKAHQQRRRGFISDVLKTQFVPQMCLRHSCNVKGAGMCL